MAYSSGYSGYGGYGGYSGYRPGRFSSILNPVDQRSRLAQMTPEERAALLGALQEVNLNQPPVDTKGESLVGKLFPDVVEDAATQIGKSLLYSPVGMYEMGKAAVEDARDLVTLKDPTAPRLRTMGAMIPAQIVEDVTHPRENIGYLLMDAFTLASMGAGGAVRASSAAGRWAQLSRIRRGLEEPPEPGPIGYGRPKPQGPRGPQELPGENVPSRHGYPEDIADLGAPQEARGAGPSQRLAELNETVKPGPLTKAQAMDEAERFTWRLRNGNMTEGQIRQWALGLRERGWSFEMLDNPPGDGANDWIIRRPKDGRKGVASTPIDKYLENRPKQQKPQVAPKRPDAPPLSPQEMQQAQKRIDEPDAYSTPDAPEQGLAPDEVRLSMDPANPNVLRAEGTDWVAVREASSGTWQLFKGDKPQGPRMGDPEGMGNHMAAMKNARDNLLRTVKEERAGEKPSLLAPDADAPKPAGMAEKLDPDAALEAVEAKRLETDAPGPISPAHEELIAETKKAPAKQSGPRGVDALPPSEKNFSPRAAGISDRQLGISPRQMARQMPDVPREKQSLIAQEMRFEARVKGGKLTAKKEFEILKKHLGDADLAKEVMKRRREISGGAEITTELMIRETLRALKGPRLPGTLKMETYDRLSDSGRQQYSRHPETYMRAEALLSRNPLVAQIQKAMYAGQKRHYAAGNKRRERAYGLGRTLEGHIKFHERETQRIIKAAEDAGIPQSIRDAYHRAKNEKREIGVGSVVDTMNQIAKIGALYLKPAYLPANMIGQIFLSLVDHAWNPVNVARTVKIQRELFKDYHGGDRGRARLATRMRQIMGEGMMHAMHYESGASKIVGTGYRTMSEVYNKILDTPFRDNAFINEAFRFGYRDADAVRRLLDAKPGTKMHNDAIEIGRRANRNLIDYARLGSLEKNWIRRVIFFYPWFKGATIYGAHFMAEHPAQAALMTNLGEDAYKNDPLKGAPSYMEGFIKVGEKEVPGIGKVARVINPTASSVLGTPGETIAAAKQFLTGGGGRSDQPSEFLTPALSAGIAGITHSDPFTGRDFPAEQGAIEIMANEMKGTVAFWRMLDNLHRADDIKSGKADPDKMLYVRTRGEAFRQFMLGVTPISANESVMRSRGAAEARSLASKKERTVLNGRDKLAEWEKVSKDAGVSMPTSVRDAFQKRIERDGELAALEASLGRKLRQIDRLRGELGLLVQSGQMDEQQARQMLLQNAVLDDAAIGRLRRALNEQFFGGALLSAWGSEVRARGGELPRL